ncbi:sigma factor [Streptomyces sp. NPDC102394]|uniref:RNA polymerase sigma factor n=1 Tax=Streptomyces sp. NPDC102394 TaxID=3366167 RepID=UPI0038014F58
MPYRINQRHHDEDRELIQRFTAHPASSPQRERAFEELHTRHRRLVLAQCWESLKDPDLAEDVAQRVFLALWNGLDTMTDPDGLHGWLRTVTRRECAGLYSSERSAPEGLQAPARRVHRKLRHREIPASHEPALFENAAAVGEEDRILLGVHVDELAALLDRYMGALPRRLKPVYRLHVQQGWDGPELARRLKVTGATMRRFKSDLLTEELARLLVTNLVAAEAARLGRQRACPDLLKVLQKGRWAGGPLSRNLVMRVDEHIGQCDICGSRKDYFRRQWRRALPLLISPSLHDSASDRVELTAAAAGGEQRSHAGAASRRTRGLAAMLVAVLGILTGGMAWQMNGDRSADTVETGSYHPGSQSSAAATARGHGSASSGANVGLPKSSHLAHSGRSAARTPNGSGHSPDTSPHPSSSPQSSVRPGNTAKETLPADVTPDQSAGTDGFAQPSTDPPNPSADPSTPAESGPGTAPSPVQAPALPSPPAPHTLTVHLNTPSAGGVRVTVNGGVIGTCSKAYEAPQKDCTYTVHTGNTVRLTPADGSLITTWGTPCAGTDPSGLCEFLIAGDLTTSLTTSYNPG